MKKGEHGSPVVYASKFTKKDKTDAGDEIEQEIPFLKQYTVFNADQVEGLPGYFYELAKAVQTKPLARIEQAERFFANTKADIRTGGNRAYYAIEADYIRIPRLECFRDSESHAATLAHELTHWTRHPSRLNREFGRKKCGDEGYAMEELVAELGSAFLCADCTSRPRCAKTTPATSPIWLKVLKDDKRAVFSAASHAQQGG